MKLPFELATADEIACELGRRLRAHRLAQNFQQSELAARAGISERALRNLERTGRGTLACAPASAAIGPNDRHCRTRCEASDRAHCERGRPASALRTGAADPVGHARPDRA